MDIETIRSGSPTVPPIGSRLLAEFVGTLIFVAVGVGAVLQAGTPGGGGLLTVALAHGLIIAVVVTVSGHISGGFVNPAVTLAMFITRRITAAAAALYVIAQIVGAAAGAALVRATYPASFGYSRLNGGAPRVASGMSGWQAVTFEAFVTFALVWTVFAVAVDRGGAWFKLAGLPIGLVVTCVILMGGNLTGAVMNPARALGPELVAGSFTDWWVYWVGPAVGATIAAISYSRLIRPVAEHAP